MRPARWATRVLDAAKTGGVENEHMREVWAELQNRALERAGEVARVDARSLEVQRAAAQTRGDALRAEELDRAPEMKLGPAANAMERRERPAAEGREYAPVTERGRAVHAARQARVLFRDMRARLEVARDAYEVARDEGQSRVSAGLAALRAAAEKDRGGRGQSSEGIRDRLEKIVEKDQGREEPARESVKDRLSALLDREKTVVRNETERDKGDERGVG